MSLRQKYLKVLADLIPAGATGVSLLLGSVTLGAASTEPSQANNDASVSERLAAIRGAVSEIASDPRQAPRPQSGVQLAKDQRSGSGSPSQTAKPPTTAKPNSIGGGGPSWHNWHNWRWGNWFRNW